ncbi:MAG TPA: DUF705 domain-containing protein [Acidimicrobiales bacterium]|nr:DUF705 domain-containing protein [Acidimicrobiales bacterium]
MTASAGAEHEVVWVFDLDGCLIDSLTGSSLRPGARALLSGLRDRGCAVVLWSAGGADYARDKATTHGIDRFVAGYHSKAGRDGNGRYSTAGLPAGSGSFRFIDDRPEDLPAGADVVVVSPYLSPDPHDDGLRRGLERAGHLQVQP